MEEIQNIALAYYANLPEETKKQADVMFKMLDSDGDGTITLKEFLALMNSDPKLLPSNRQWFKDLDKSGDGKLDFEEFLSFFYLVITGRVFVICDGCGCNLYGVHFTCEECFPGRDTFDLCLPCYRGRNYTHGHNNFLDNYALLRKIRKENLSEQTSEDAGDTESEELTFPESDELIGATKTRSKTKKVMKAVDVFVSGYNVGHVVGQVAVAAGCTIM